MNIQHFNYQQNLEFEDIISDHGIDKLPKTYFNKKSQNEYFITRNDNVSQQNMYVI